MEREVEVLGLQPLFLLYNRLYRQPYKSGFLDFLQYHSLHCAIACAYIIYYCCPVKLKIAQDLSPNSFIIKDSDFFMIKASPPN